MQNVGSRMSSISVDNLSESEAQLTAKSTHRDPKAILKYALIGLGAIAISIGLMFLPIPYHRLGNYGYLGIFLISLIASAGMVIPVPSTAALFVGATFLNPPLLGLIFGIGSTIGELTGYGVGYGGRAILEGNSSYERIARWMQRYGMLALFIFAIIPNPIFDAGGFACGALRMPVWKFLVAIGGGRIIRGIGLAVLASQFPEYIHHFLS